MNFIKRNGLLVPDKAQVMGFYRCTLLRGGEKIDEWDADNLVVQQGLTAMLNIMFAGISIISNWYIGVAQNNYTPVSTDTASSIVGNFGEVTAYSGGARPSFTAAQATSPSVTNSASQATFNFTGSATLTGAFLISSATPGSNSGTLYSAAQFGASKSVGNGDQLTLTYTTSLSGS